MDRCAVSVDLVTPDSRHVSSITLGEVSREEITRVKGAAGIHRNP